MFVFKKTYENLKDRHDARGKELNETTNKLRTERQSRQEVEGQLKAEKQRTAELNEKLAAGENSWDKAKSDIGRLRENIQNYSAKASELGKLNKTLFARAGGFAQQFKSMQKRILSAGTLRELKKHVEKSLHRAERKEKREAAAATG